MEVNKSGDTHFSIGNGWVVRARYFNDLQLALNDIVQEENPILRDTLSFNVRFIISTFHTTTTHLFHSQHHVNAIYTHCYDPTFTRLFVGTKFYPGVKLNKLETN